MLLIDIIAAMKYQKTAKDVDNQKLLQVIHPPLQASEDFNEKRLQLFPRLLSDDIIPKTVHKALQKMKKTKVTCDS